MKIGFIKEEGNNKKEIETKKELKVIWVNEKKDKKVDEEEKELMVTSLKEVDLVQEKVTYKNTFNLRVFMEILNYSNDQTLRYLGGLQLRTVGKKYRFNKFCIKVEVEEGTLIYNGLSGAMVMIKPVELMNIETEDPCDYVDFLINHWFLVPIKYDEEAILNIIKERERTIITDTYLDHPEHFTILTTSACNARCFYCYELGLKNKTHMSLETAEKVAKYIIKHAPKDRSVTLDWFGGEPLFNHKMISIISSRVRSAGFDIQGTMISNGYLFDDNLIKTAMKAGDKVSLNAYKNLKAEIQVFKTAKNAKPYTEAIEIQIVSKMCKKLEDAIENFSKAHREDLISDYTNELDVLKKLLPEPVDESQICSFIEHWCLTSNLLNNTSAPEIPKNIMGKAIKCVKEQYPQVDGKTISQLVKKYIR